MRTSWAVANSRGSEIVIAPPVPAVPLLVPPVVLISVPFRVIVLELVSSMTAPPAPPTAPPTPLVPVVVISASALMMIFPAVALVMVSPPSATPARRVTEPPASPCETAVPQ